jgi:aldose 1-epimerase
VTAWSFLGWDGTARIETPSTGLAITLTASADLDCPVVWAPAGADFLCVEPQSHAIGAPSEPAARAASPLRRLAPGETLEGWLRIAPEAL